MSIEADNINEQRAIQSQLEEMTRLLAGILAGIALMNGLTPSQLIELAEGL